MANLIILAHLKAICNNFSDLIKKEILFDLLEQLTLNVRVQSFSFSKNRSIAFFKKLDQMI